MVRFAVEFQVQLVGDLAPGEVEAWSLAVLDELMNLDDAVDAGVSAALALGTVTFTFLVDSESRLPTTRTSLTV